MGIDRRKHIQRSQNNIIPKKIKPNLQQELDWRKPRRYRTVYNKSDRNEFLWAKKGCNNDMLKNKPVTNN